MVRPAEELTFELLKRFEETLKTPFRRALETGRVELKPPPEAGSEADDALARAVAAGRAAYDEKECVLVLPLTCGGRPLGVLMAHEVEADQLQAPVRPFLTALVEAALDLVRLRRAQELDPLTGLANESALEEALISAISRLAPAKTRGRPTLEASPDQERQLALLAVEPQGLALLQERHGRARARQVFEDLAGRLAEAAPEALAAARAGNAFYLLLAGGAAAAEAAAARLRRSVKDAQVTGGLWRGRLHLGVALAGERESAEAPAAEAAALLKARAGRAVKAAARAGLSSLLFFHQIPDRAGRVREVMPLDRVLMDLGRAHGVAEGERFAILAAGAESVKAEVVVVSLGEEESLAELVALAEPTQPPRPGDALRRLAPSEQPLEAVREETVQLSGGPVRVVLEEATGAAVHRSLMAVYQALCEQGRAFAVALFRVEGLEGMREICGSLGAESLMHDLAQAVRAAFEDGAVLGRHSPDTLAVLLPEAGAEAAHHLAGRALTALAQADGRPVRAGVAAHPCPGFGAADALDNAAKALAHAGFLEPMSAVIFDAVSLNISGDDLFNQGRYAEAVAEYTKALGLAPEEPNVLNSMGVCYGHLGQSKQAVEWFRRAIAAAPDDLMAHFNLGYTLMGLGRPDKALEHLHRCLELAPEHADTLFQLGRLAQEAGEAARALKYLERAMAAPDCRRTVHRLRGECLVALDRAAEAETAFKQAVKAHPGDAAALAGLAGLYLERGANLEIAATLARRALALDPGRARHARLLGRALMSLGKAAEAVEVLRRATAEHAADARLAQALGLALEAAGEPEAALRELGRALELDPALAEARQALARLGGS